MKKLIKFDDGNALFPNAIDTQNYKELEVYKNLTFFIKYVLFTVFNTIMISEVLS